MAALDMQPKRIDREIEDVGKRVKVSPLNISNEILPSSPLSLSVYLCMPVYSVIATTVCTDALKCRRRFCSYTSRHQSSGARGNFASVIMAGHTRSV